MTQAPEAAENEKPSAQTAAPSEMARYEECLSQAREAGRSLKEKLQDDPIAARLGDDVTRVRENVCGQDFPQARREKLNSSPGR